MKGMRNSGYASGRSNGVLVKQQGSIAPSLDGDPAADSKPKQFEVSAHKDGENWYLSVQPGYALTHDQTIANITSPNGNRDLDPTKLRILPPVSGSYTRGATVLYKIEKCHCYKGVRYPSLATVNDISKQQFLVDNTTDWLVIAYRCTPASALPPRLAIIKASDWKDYFTYVKPDGGTLSDYSAGTGGYAVGTNAVFNYIPVFTTNFAANTGTTDGHTHTYTLRNLEKFIMRVQRVGLLARPIALFEGTTGKVYQYTNEILDLDISPEVTWGDIDTATTGGYVDQNFQDCGYAAYYYVTGQTNAPSGYTFNYT